ncbi:MAG: fatty-acyl-CoA synthase [Sphingomonadales bacterium]|jgi:acyl-CoA synthetase (AMP-forming)/AMP-acid ligase II|nr:fatty-acyl-CoA synthase [Sphingomonadales bacterium]
MTGAPYRATLDAQLGRVARQRPDAVALKFGAEALSYAALDARASRLANALIALGVRPGDRVAVLMLNRLELVEAYFGILRAGAVCVPVNFRLVAQEVAYILENSGATIVICDGVSGVPERPDLVVVTTDGGPAARRYEALLAAAPSAPPQIAASEHDPAFIMYTSGTTGRPKGAVLSHLNLLMNSMNMIAMLEIGRSDRCWLAGLPLFHIGGLNGILPFLHLGGTSIILPSGDFDPADTVAIMERERVTSCFFVPTQWQAICAVPDIARSRLCLQRVSWGASTITAATLATITDTFPGVRTYNAFGQTEMSSITCVMRVDEAPAKAASIGRPVSGVEARLVDAEGRDVAPGEAGEIIYRGPTVMLGYWNDPEATAEAMRDGWFHSGDMSRVDEEGFHFLVDRKKDMIISGGENIYCPEVEAAIAAHPDVRDVAVIGLPHPKWVETPVAIVVAADGASLDAEAIIAWCRGLLASYKKPTRVHFIASLPRNASGKVLKPKLREMFCPEGGRTAP